MFNHLKKYPDRLKRLIAFKLIRFEVSAWQSFRESMALWKRGQESPEKTLKFKPDPSKRKSRSIPLASFLYSLQPSLIHFALFFYSFNSYSNTADSPKPNAFEQFFPFLLIGLFFYFILIRPQQKKHKQHGDFLSKIKRGDEVLTNSGIYGRIEGLTDSFVILEVAENVRIRIAKSQIASYTGDANQPQKNPKKKEKLRN
ncbi:MAG: preprotein translocase subunit YajC [Oligoflexia bacterium]|nr:preprotein translocase subunit YajC [Oligoflexia bacterium]